MQSVDAVLRQAAADLDAIGARWAVVGGLAVAFRAEPRFTKDVDVAVAVADDREAEDIVNRLQVRGYALASLVEQDYVDRLATARLIRNAATTADRTSPKTCQPSSAKPGSDGSTARPHRTPCPHLWDAQ